MKSAKGGSYEREICKMLSLWWSDGERDDIFWRSSNSGGRATVRRRMGKDTAGHTGDVAATHSSGHALIEACALELKRGYSRVPAGLSDALDRHPRMSQQPFEAFVAQAREAAINSKAKAWLLIQRRDSRSSMIYFPRRLLKHLVRVTDAVPFVEAKLEIRIDKKGKAPIEMQICGTTLEQFLKLVSRKDFSTLS